MQARSLMRNREINKGVDYNSAMLSMNYEAEGAKFISPDVLRSARNLLSDDYATQEIIIKSFTEFEIDHKRQQSQTQQNQYNSSQIGAKKHNLLQKNQQNAMKLDPYHKFLALSYGAPFTYYDPLNNNTAPSLVYPPPSQSPELPYINQILIADSEAQQTYGSQLMNQGALHLLNQMHSPSKIKTNKDLFKRNIIGNQFLEGAWIFEPKHQRSKMEDIVIKGQSVPNHLVMGGGVMPPPRKQKRATLQSARGGREALTIVPKQNNEQQQHLIPKYPTSPRKPQVKVSLKENLVTGSRGGNEDGLQTEEQNNAGGDNNNNQQTKQSRRPQSKYRQQSQKITSQQNPTNSQANQIKSNKPINNNQRNSTDMRLKKNNSIAEPLGGTQQKLSNYQSQAQIKDKKEEIIVEQGNSENKEDEVILEDQNTIQNQSINKNNYSFRPRRPIVNPVEQARLEQERMIQIKNEAKEKYHQISLQNKQNNQKLKYIICPGNNSQVIKRCMELRTERWEETNDFDTLFNFKWHPISKGIKFDILNTHGTRQLVNHFENHDCITTKDQMFKNFLAYCEGKKVNAFEYLPLTFVLEVDSVNYAYDLDKFITYFSYIEKTIESQVHQNQQDLGQDSIIQVLQTINSKNQNYQAYKDEKQPQFAKRKIPEAHFSGFNIWMLKATGFNRGRGIHVFNKLEELKKLIKEYTDGLNFETQYSSQQQTNKLINKQLLKEIQASQKEQSNQQNSESLVPSYLKSTSFVIQKYVENPMLLHKRKFDIRVWVFVAQDARCYFFKEGYIRTSCEEFTLSQESIGKAYVHLTNNAVQKYSENYGKFEDGNQLSFADLQDIIKGDHGTDRENYVKEEMVPQMKDIIKMNLESVRRKLKITTNTRGQGSCFELFGYDFIIDANFGLWLIEVNTNPCLEESSQLLCKYIPRMINDLLKLAIDPVFPPKKGQQPYDPQVINKFTVDSYTNEENMWEYLCQLDPYITGNDKKEGNGGGVGGEKQNAIKRQQQQTN